MPTVRDALRLLAEHGWVVVRTRGSHRHLKHPVLPGTVTVAGRPSLDLKPGTWSSILRQAGIRRRED